jgi:UDP-glucose:(heptosyl)LPS alpha-1,3-glucosyltransferase
MLRILQIVRTFAPVGGMETYVFETSRELVARGHQVSVLCRSTEQAAAARVGVRTMLLNPDPARRGWQDRILFQRAVAAYLRPKASYDTFDIVHSHENTTVQDISTEHGPSTLAGLRKAPWKFLDYSALRNLLLERSKFSACNLVALASCSSRVERLVLKNYPSLQSKLRQVIPPAYSYLPQSPEDSSQHPPTLGFMGFDWKRKGLPKALDVFRVLKEEDPRWRMLVAGCDPQQVPERLRRRVGEGVSFLGRSDPVAFFHSIDILLHPAREEPFGMVVAEALSSGVPAVVSDRCGCVEHLRSDGLRVIASEAPAPAWSPLCRQMAAWRIRKRLSLRTWSHVAAEHEEFYGQILDRKQKGS